MCQHDPEFTMWNKTQLGSYKKKLLKQWSVTYTLDNNRSVNTKKI